MEQRRNQVASKFVLLLKYDSQNLLRRLQDRKKEIVEIFALRRTREHFFWIFKNRYESATLKDLAYCSSESITSLNDFYNLADEMKWYLYETQDLPSTAEDNLTRMIKRLEKIHTTLDLYLSADLGVEVEAEQNSFTEDEKPSYDYEFLTQEDPDKPQIGE